MIFLKLLLMSAVARAMIQDSSMIRLKDSESEASEASKLTRPSFVPKIPEHCRNQGLCGDVPNYPQKYIDELLQSNSTEANALKFLVRGFDGKAPSGCKSINQDPNDIKLCASKIKLILPQAGQDSDGQWRFLIGENWACVEICEKAGESCSEEGIHVYSQYTATCIQKYITKRVVGLDSNGSVSFFDTQINGACCCHLTQKT